MRPTWLASLGALLVTLGAAGCGSSDGDLDPADLEVRDLLGLEPSVGLRWDADERAAARRVLTRALAAESGPEDECELPVGYGVTASERVLATLEMHDHDLAEAERPPVAAARVELPGELRLIPVAVDLDALLARPADPAVAPPHMIDWQDWPELAARAPQLLVDLAAAAGHPAGEELAVESAERAPVAAAYLPEQRTLLVNPILLAALDPTEGAAPASSGAAPAIVGALPSVNPYNFYASLGDCALDQQARCAACVASGGCDPESDAQNGLFECMTLAGDPRGFVLFCTNLALAIITVAECMDFRAPSCPTVEAAGDQLGALQANAAVLDDPMCVDALNACLAEIYGDGQASTGDAGPGPQPGPRNGSCNNCEGDCEEDCDDDCDNDGDDDCNAQCDEEGDSCTYQDCTCTNDPQGGTTCDCDDDGNSDCSSDGMGKSNCDCGDQSSESGDSDCSCRGRDEMGNSSCTCGDGEDACTCTKDMNGQDECSCGEPEGSTGGNENGCRTVPVRRRVASLAPALSLGVTIAWGFLPVAVLLIIRRRMKR